MSKLIDNRKTKSIKLPSFPEDEIVIYEQLLTSDVSRLQNESSEYLKGLLTLVYLIKSWSFTDENDNQLPITKENVERLPVNDFNFIMDKVNETLNFLDKGTKKD